VACPLSRGDDGDGAVRFDDREADLFERFEFALADFQLADDGSFSSGVLAA